MKPWPALAPLLVCPVTRQPLQPRGPDGLVTTEGREYALVDGVPVLRPGPVKQIDPRHESNSVAGEVQQYMRSRPGPVLFLGAGSTSFRADNVIEVEYDVFRNTDVVADAHHLPVADGTVAAVVALNLFEHLADPPQAAREIRRVLRPGGEVLIHTAFLQPLHEEPAHYYNATEFGLRRWFDGFADVKVTVSDNFNPYWGLTWFASDLLRHARATMPPGDYYRLGDMTLRELAAGWERRGSDGTPHGAFGRLPDGVQRRLAAGFQLEARKEGP